MINIPKGTKDILPKDSYKWHKVYDVARKLARKYNLKEIMTPTFEHTELFIRGVGEGSDIVSKEMYTFKDRSDRSITLKPEGTAGVARAVIENSLYADALPLKMYYITPCFRYERPQAGRLREHHQFGVEIYGANTAVSDVEALSIAMDFYSNFGVTPTVLLNSLGCKNCRPAYIDALREYYKSHIGEMCEDCKRRYETNVLRILDCKVDICKEITKNAPVITDYLCDECKAKLDETLALLDKSGVKYKLSSRLVRGIDYYTNLVFEFVDEDVTLGQNALGAGGRYNNLVGELGGKDCPVIGFGIGIERLLGYLAQKNITIEDNEKVDIYVASMVDAANTLDLVRNLRERGYSVDYDILSRSLKSQFKYADKIGAKYVITYGEDELNSGLLSLKDMSSGKSTKCKIEELKI